MVRQCQVCRKTDHNYPDLTFHSFPSDTNKRKIWCSLLGFGENRLLPKRPEICSEHFEPNGFHYKSDGRKYLNKDADPKPHHAFFDPPVNVSLFTSAREHGTTQCGTDVEKTLPYSVPFSCSAFTPSNVGKQSCPKDPGLQENSAAILNTAKASLNVSTPIYSGQFKTEDIGLEPGKKIIVLKKGAVSPTPVALPFSILRESINASVYSDLKSEDIGLPPGGKVVVLSATVPPAEVPDLVSGFEEPSTIKEETISSSNDECMLEAPLDEVPNYESDIKEIRREEPSTIKEETIPSSNDESTLEAILDEVSHYVSDIKAISGEEPSIKEEAVSSSDDESTLEAPLDEVLSSDSDVKCIRDLKIEVKSSSGRQTAVIPCEMEISEVSKVVANSIWPGLQNKPLNSMQNQRQHGDVSGAGSSGNSKPANEPLAKMSQGLIKAFSDIQYEDMEDPETRKMCWKIIKATIETNKRVISNLKSSNLRKRYRIDTLKSRKTS